MTDPPKSTLAPRLLGVFAAGAVLGTLGDRLHTLFGVLSYPHPTLFDEAWWVPLLMGGGGVALALSHADFRRRFGASAHHAPRDVALSTGWFAVAYAATAVGARYPIALTVALVASFVARALGAFRTRTAWLYSLGAAVGGSLWEAGLSATGAFRYRAPHLIGIPIWLPALYLHAALLVHVVESRWPIAPGSPPRPSQRNGPMPAT